MPEPRAIRSDGTAAAVVVVDVPVEPPGPNRKSGYTIEQAISDKAQSTTIAFLFSQPIEMPTIPGTVTLALRADGRLARLRVSDTGIGIPAADLPALFERFHRGANASAYPGSGLGLAIVRATIELDGGTVRAESDGAGSAFEVTLPLV